MKDVFSNMIESVRKSRNISDFMGIDRKTIAGMSDKELSVWQAKYPPDSPQSILAGYEWLCRLNREQNKTAREIAWIGVFATLAGTVLGVALGFWIK